MFQTGCNFAHATTALLPWHVQICDLLGSVKSRLRHKKYSQCLDYVFMNHLCKGCPLTLVNIQLGLVKDCLEGLSQVYPYCCKFLDFVSNLMLWIALRPGIFWNSRYVTVAREFRLGIVKTKTPAIYPATLSQDNYIKQSCLTDTFVCCLECAFISSDIMDFLF